MLLRLASAIAIILLLLPTIAKAETDKRTPLEVFRGDSQYQLFKCSIDAKTAILQVSIGELVEPSATIISCQQSARSTLKKSFPKALASLPKKRAAAQMLKDYYAACLSALNGMLSQVEELKFIYESRQGDAMRKVDDSWTRFEIETQLP
jgi:hypothetical protein